MRDLEAESPPRLIKLHSGESATFGSCACGRCEIDLPLVGTHAALLAGEVTAADELWLVTNLSDSEPMIVENLEKTYEYVMIDPCRCGAPVPFELARVSAAESVGLPEVTVFGPEPRHTKAATRPCAAAIRSRPLLDRNAAYFAVLEILSEPRLAGVLTAPLPTSAEIAARLSRSGAYANARSVDAHIEYVTGKLGLRRGVGRDVVVATAIRRGVFA